MSNKKARFEGRAKTVRSRLDGKVAAPRSNLVIGLTGPLGSGCSTMAKLLEGQHGFKRYKIADAIREELAAEGKLMTKGEEGWRNQLQVHGNERRKQSLSYWVDKILQKLKADGITNEPLVVDGIRNFSEVETFRRHFSNFFVVAICEERVERWRRVRPEYQGRQDEFERDDRRDQNEESPWGQSVQKCVDDADYVFFNNVSHYVTVKSEEKADTIKIQRDFERQVRDFLPLMHGQKGRPPSPDEVQMAAAYALSNASSCIKRHVGAVITIVHENRELPVSMGYNENPAGMQRCVDNGGCLKDEHIRSWFDVQDVLFCPHCGVKIQAPMYDQRCKCGDSLMDWLWRTRGMELCTALHAEERAIRSLGDRSAKHGTLYVTTFPCFQCARMVLDVGIEKVVYVEAYPGLEAKEFLIMNGCKVLPFNGFTARAFFRAFHRVS